MRKHRDPPMDLEVAARDIKTRRREQFNRKKKFKKSKKDYDTNYDDNWYLHKKAR